MIDHVDFAVSDYLRSRDFYVKVLATLGISALTEINHADGRHGTGFGTSEARFWIGGGRPVEGRFHIAFEAPSRAAVVAFYEAALAAGAEDRGQPGLRPRYGNPYFAAFVLDPDGHVIEAVCRGKET